MVDTVWLVNTEIPWDGHWTISVFEGFDSVKFPTAPFESVTLQASQPTGPNGVDVFSWMNVNSCKPVEELDVREVGTAVSGCSRTPRSNQPNSKNIDNRAKIPIRMPMVSPRIGDLPDFWQLPA